jgi:PAS domain S-box-containing protein
VARVDDAAGTVVVRQRLDPHPSSVSSARRLVTAALSGLGRAELADDAALAVSELVTNALVHAGTPMEVVVSQRGAEVVVEVLDDNPRLPFRRHHAELAGTGRGLRLVEQLVDAWGARERPPGKAVWFLLGPGTVDAAVSDDSGPDAGLDTRPADDLEALLTAFPDDAPFPDDAAERPEVGAAAEPLPEVVEVVLLSVPLLLHAAWQMQAESVLREYLLVRLNAEDEVERELEWHAAVHEAVVLLQEHIPAPDLGEHPEQLMAAAAEPFASAERLLFPVPAASVQDFEKMDVTLDAAMELAEAGALLTPPTQPEVREFRRWLCRQVREQSTGAAPEPWAADVGTDRTPTVAAPEWDASAVTTADVPLVAGADTNRIVAASPAAARLLGYPSPEDLVGRRLVDIIPVRFRQAHLAGFTLHLFAGRQPLLGQRVVVPALRRDGSEVVVVLLVEAVSLPGGRHVFVAELTET